ncbi:MAG: cytochrome c biogenesis protein CcsA [Planctomycetota bacterium]
MPLLRALASLRLTVALLAASMLLVFAGTIAQVEQTNFSVVADYFRSWAVLIPVRLFAELLFNTGPLDWPWVLPWPAGKTLGLLLAVNLLAAHAIRFKPSLKRVGIIFIHLGLIVLLLGETITGMAAEEWQMSIHEGDYANFAEDIRTTELAVVDTSDPEIDHTVAIPQAALAAAAQSRQPISHPELPFDILINRWMANSAIAGPAMVTPQLRSAQENTRGLGDRLFPIGRPEVTGVEEQIADMPSAYITLLDKQTAAPLGRYMLSLHLDIPQRVEAPITTPAPQAGAEQSAAPGTESTQPAATPTHPLTNHTLELRFKRDYKPYQVHLLDFDHAFFPGTQVATRFVSNIRLVDPRYGEDRRARIAMNEPLRYRGWTFFQSGYQPDGSGTFLQVVRNPGWTLPYIACGLATFGLVFHFGLMVWTGMRKRTKAQAPSAISNTSDESAPQAEPKPRRPWATPSWWVTPAAALAVFLLVIGAQLRPAAQDSAFDLAAAGQIPVSGDGRVKPLESEAKGILIKLSHKTTVKRTVNGEEQRIPAVQWVLDLLARPQATFYDPVIRIDEPGVKALIGIEDHNRKLFTPSEVFHHREAIYDQAMRADTTPSPQRSAFQRHVIDLAGKMSRLEELRAHQRPYMVAPLAAGQEWQPLGAAMHAAHASLDPQAHEGHDHTAADAANPASVEAWTNLLMHYSNGNADAFNAAVDAYLAEFDTALPAATTRASIETGFNRVNPFYVGIILYVMVAVLVFKGWLFAAGNMEARSRFLLRGAFWLALFTVVLHTVGIALRIYITERPPVTNLYSSAVFIGWASAIFALVLERFSRTGIGSLVAATVGAATLIVALNLALLTGDTKQMMQAVLDSNFWLATHVITITLGYAAVFVAGTLGIVYILAGVYTTILNKERAKAIYNMMYGVVGFALLFSFVGTVLGGIWADQSWGRFWGWDPKENGAILIVLILAIALHARWGGMIQGRGFAIICVLGNIVTAWSWFGTNMLGVGLHSYGFMESGRFWIKAFVVVMLAIAAAGLLPLPRWGSAHHLAKPPAKRKPAAPGTVAPA